MFRSSATFALLAKNLSALIVRSFALSIVAVSFSTQAATVSAPFKQRALGYVILGGGTTIYSNASDACRADPISVLPSNAYYEFLYVQRHYDGYDCVVQEYANGQKTGIPHVSISVMRAYENVCESPFEPAGGGCVFTSPEPNVCPASTNNPIEIATGKKVLNEQNYRGNFVRPLELNFYYSSVKPRSAVKSLPHAIMSFPTPISSRITSRIPSYELICEPRESDPEYASICPTPNMMYNPARTTAPGMGWNHNGQRGIVILPSGQGVVVYRANGSGYLFELKNGVWTPALPVAGKLEKLVNSDWKYTDRNDESEVYDTNGRLLSVTDRAGMSQAYTYDAIGRIDAITDAYGNKLTLGYDAKNRLSTMTNPAGQVDHYSYDAQNNFVSLTHADNTSKTYLYEDSRFPNALTGVIDESGNRYMTYHYDDQGRAVSEESFNNVNHNQLIFGADGKSTTLIDALGTSSTLSFTEILGALRLTSQTQASGSGCEASSRNIAYDANGNTISRTNFNGTLTTYTYEPVRNLEVKRVEASGTVTARTITTVWHANFRTPVQINEPLLKTTFTHDTNGNVLTKTVQATTDVDGSQGAAASVTGTARVWSKTYNNVGQVLTETGSRTDVVQKTTYTYDNKGNVASITNALGQVTQYISYDLNGRPLEIIKPDGSDIKLGYDLRGHLTSSNVDGDVTSLGYDAAGNLTSITSPTGAITTYTYDAAHRLTAIKDTLGNRIEYTLDNAGNITNVATRDTGGVLRYQQQKIYDALSRVKQIVDNKNNTTTLLYDANGNPTGVTDPKLQNTTSAFDNLDQLKLTTNALNGQTAFAYDAQGNVTQVTDPKNHSTTYTYNAFGDLISQTSPDTGTTTFTYDAAGNRTSATDARGVVVNYTYDALNRLTSVKYPAAASENVTFNYDSTANGSYGIGRLASVSTSAARNDYVYNHLGLITKKFIQIGSTLNNIQYTYDAAGNLSSIIYPSGRLVTYVRDAAGRVTSITTKATSTATVQTLISGAAYLPFGPISSYAYGNGLTHTLTYDTDYRLNSIQVGNVLSRGLGYDADDNITSISDGIASNKNQLFNYDALNRLTSATGVYGSLGYTYDAVGNRLTETLGSTTATYNLETTSNRLLGITKTGANRSFTYDLAGNRITGTSDTGTAQAYTYNNANRLASASVGGTTAGTYQYNPLGQRVSKTVAGNVQELYHYDEAGQLIAVTDGAGNTKREYIYNGNSLVSFVNVATTTNAIPNITLLPGNATITGGALAKTQTGYTGTAGYINFTGEGQATWTTSIGNAATYTSKVRYAMTGANRVMDVYVDNVKKTSITFTATTNLNTWSTKSVNLSLTKGTHTISLKTTGTSGPNIDTNVLSTTATTSTTTTSVYYVHNDHKNTPQLVTNQSKAVVFTADYQPFGKLQAQTNSIELYSRFPGQSLDSETGLYYNYFRDYDPSIGRYIESDPIGLGGGVNTYSYVKGRPIIGIDPLGLYDLNFSTGFHIPITPVTWGLAVGPTIASHIPKYSENPYNDFVADPITIDAAIGTIADIGGQVGISDISKTEGKCAGWSLNFGAGKYAGAQIVLRSVQDQSLSIFNPFRYIDGVSIGLGMGLALPVTASHGGPWPE